MKHIQLVQLTVQVLPISLIISKILTDGFFTSVPNVDEKLQPNEKIILQNLKNIRNISTADPVSLNYLT